MIGGGDNCSTAAVGAVDDQWPLCLMLWSSLADRFSPALIREVFVGDGACLCSPTFSNPSMDILKTLGRPWYPSGYDHGDLSVASSSATEDPPCRGGQCTLNLSRLTILPLRAALGEECLNDGCEDEEQMKDRIGRREEEERMTQSPDALIGSINLHMELATKKREVSHLVDEMQRLQSSINNLKEISTSK
ncbi:homeobox protein cut-like, partial [Trichonephila clavipes]